MLALADTVPHAVTHPASRHLLRGNPPSPRTRRPPLHERMSIALGGMFGPEVREVAYCVGEGVRRRTMSPTIGKMILERVLPAARPVQLDLPRVTSGADLIEAEDRITQALNAGLISPQEARTLQAWARASFRSRRVAKATMGDG